MNIHAPVMLYHKAVLIGLSEFPSFLRYIFSKAAKNAEFNPQKIPKCSAQIKKHQKTQIEILEKS